MAYAQHTYVVEVYSGHGSVSQTIRRMLGCPVETLDIDPGVTPTICLDALQWDRDTHAVPLLTKYPKRQPIIFASPPCEHYSRMRTTSPRDLELADKHVDAVRKISDDLAAAVVFIENPATGLLKTRDVIDFMPHRYTVDYCQYGFLYKKSTMIWCNKELVDFQPKRCPGATCASVCEDLLRAKRYRHVYEYVGMPTDQRQRVPDQLVVSLMKHALPYLVPRGRQHREAASCEDYEVDYILAVRRQQDEELMLKVQWKGYDTPSWIKRSDLNAPLEDYDYISNDIRAQALAA